MKIFIVTSAYPNSVNKNHGIFVHNQCLALIELGHEVIVLDPSGYNYKNWNRSNVFNIDSIEGVKVYSKHYRDFMNTKFPWISTKKFLKNLFYLFNKAVEKYGKPDLIHAHFTFIAGYGAFELSRTLNIPYIVTEHHSLFLKKNIHPYIKLCLHKTIKNAAAFICVSEHLKKAITEKVNTDKKILVVPNMVKNTFRYHPVESNKNFTFFTAGNLIKSKRIDFIIEAFCNAVKPEEKVMLEIAGDGPEEYVLKEKIRLLNRSDQIRMLGQLSQETMIYKYKSCHCYISASLYETFGIVYREAMAIGRPIIATKNKGIEESWQPSFGILIGTHDSLGFTDAIKHMINNYSDFNNKYISNQSLSMFSQEKITEKLHTIYIEVIKND